MQFPRLASLGFTGWLILLIILAYSKETLTQDVNSTRSVETPSTTTTTTTTTESVTSSTDATSSSISSSESILANTTEAPSPFLKHGGSYQGVTASKLLAQSISSVAVAVTIDNWTKWALILPEESVICGKYPEADANDPSTNSQGPAVATAAAGPAAAVHKDPRADQEDDAESEPSESLPTLIKPGFSEVFLVEKQAGWTGVCGSASYLLEVDPGQEPEYLVVMFSVPYNFFFLNSYFAVGSSHDYMNITDLFRTMYYYTGPFARAASGEMAEYRTDRLLIRGNMEPDTYKPILSVQVLPANKSDQFKPGEYYIPRRLRSRAPTTGPWATAWLLLLATAAASTCADVLCL